MADQATAEPAPKKKAGALIALVVLTLIALGTGGGLGIHLASTVEQAVTAREAELPEKTPTELKYSGDMVLVRLEPVIANLSAPSNTWVRIESSIVFENGALANPEASAAQIAQDMIAYLRTLSLSQLQGPTALQYLRDDLNERAMLRTDGQVRELIIETMVVQ